jgi:uncharacterized membrane protein
MSVLVLIVLFGGLVLFRALGALGVSAFGTWRESTIYALAIMFCFTAFAHFGRLRDDLARMVPPWVPNPKAVVVLTGILEILGAIGLIIPDTRWLAGVCLIAFLVAVFPANIRAAQAKVKLGARLATPLWIRGPMQILLILLVFWVIT